MRGIIGRFRKAVCDQRTLRPVSWPLEGQFVLGHCELGGAVRSALVVSSPIVADVCRASSGEKIPATFKEIRLYPLTHHLPLALLALQP